jgi:AhpD family alkylhydroperoxidase
LDYTAIAPAGIKALGSVYGYIVQSGLPRLLVNLVYLRISQINGCAYCIDMHSRDLIKDGLAVEKLVLVPAWREAGSLFDSRERAALAWTETVTRVADTAIPDGEFKSASMAFSEKELADPTIAIGLMNAYNRLAIGFRNAKVRAALSTTRGLSNCASSPLSSAGCQSGKAARQPRDRWADDRKRAIRNHARRALRLSAGSGSRASGRPDRPAR